MTLGWKNDEETLQVENVFLTGSQVVLINWDTFFLSVFHWRWSGKNNSKLGVLSSIFGGPSLKLSKPKPFLTSAWNTDL